MRVLLAKPENLKIRIVIPSMPLGYLASILRDAGHEVAYLDCVKERLDLKGIRKWLIKNGPFDVVGLTVFSCDVYRSQAFFDVVKELWPNCWTMAGGPHPSSIPDNYLETSKSLDFCFQGESEKGILPLFDYFRDQSSVKLEDIPGLVWRDGGAIRLNPRGTVDSLDSIPYPAWDIIRPDTYPLMPHGSFAKRPPVAPMVTTRGCPYHCTFCAVNLTNGRSLRKRSIENLMGEIEWLYHDFGIREIHLEDDNFTLARNRAIQFCDELRNRKLDIAWAIPNGLRLDTLTADVLKAMESVGCYSFAVGIESGSEQILLDMKRDVTLQTMRDKLNLIAEHTDIRVTGYIIIGYPTETRETIQETLDFVRTLPLHRADFHNYGPLPGTESFNALIASGQIKMEDVRWDRLTALDVAFVPRGMTIEEIKGIVKRAMFGFYLRPKVIRGLLSEIQTLGQAMNILRRAMATLTY